MGLDGTGGLLGSPANGPLRPIGNPSPTIAPKFLWMIGVPMDP